MYQIVSKDSEIIVCYAPSVGRTRLYRQSINNLDKGMKVKQYKKRKNADELCEELNEVWGLSGQVFVVQEV